MIDARDHVTPDAVCVPRRNVVVVVKHEGYAGVNVSLTKTLNGWVFGNTVVGDLLGARVASSTGAVHKYDPNTVFVELGKSE